MPNEQIPNQPAAQSTSLNQAIANAPVTPVGAGTEPKPPVSPFPLKNPKIIAGIVVVILGVLGWSAYSFFKSKSDLTISMNDVKPNAALPSQTVPPPAANPAPPPPVTAAPEPLEFASVSSASQGAMDSLPQVVQVLVVPASESTKVETVKFNDGKTGFAIEYLVSDKNLMDFHIGLTKLLTTGNWKILIGRRMENSGSIDAEHKDFRLKLTEEVKNNTILVKLLIQNIL